MLPKVLKELIISYLYLPKPISIIKDNKLVNFDNFWFLYIDYHFCLKQKVEKLTIKETAEYASDMLDLLCKKELYFTTLSFSYIIHTLSPDQIAKILNDFPGQSLCSYVMVRLLLNLHIPDAFQFTPPTLPQMDNNLPINLHILFDINSKIIYKTLLQLIEVPTEYVTPNGIKTLPFDADKHDWLAYTFMIKATHFGHLQLLERAGRISEMVLLNI